MLIYGNCCFYLEKGYESSGKFISLLFTQTYFDNVNTYQLLKKGAWHPVFCEDFLCLNQSDNGFYFAVVLDGCSAGKDAHIASGIIGKLLFKSWKATQSEVTKSLKERVKSLLKKVFDGLCYVKDFLQLETIELLSTFSVVVYDKKSKKAIYVVSGDGIIVIDDVPIHIDHQNMPDYMAYHLEKGFEAWHESSVKYFEATNPRNLAIATDGLLSFCDASGSSVDVPAIRQLLVDTDWLGELSTEEALMKIEKEHNVTPVDDIALVRIVL